MQEFEIVETLVRRNLARAGNCDRLREQRATAIASIADAYWNPCCECHGGRLKGILEKDGAFKGAGFERPRGSQFVSQGSSRIRNHFIAERLAMIQVGDPRFSEDRDVGPGKAFPKSSQGGQGHDGVTDPVGGPYEDLLIGHNQGVGMSPTASYFMLLGGLLVAYIEFVRPGLVVPGVAGGVAAIWGLSRLASMGLNWEPAAMFVIGALLLVVQAWIWKGKSFRTSWIGGIGVLCMWWGSAHLVKMPLRIDPQAAELGAGAFALITLPLLGVAFRARRNKAIV